MGNTFRTDKERYYGVVAFASACFLQFVFPGLLFNTINVYTGSILAEFPAFSRTTYALTITTLSTMCTVVLLTIGWWKKKIGLRAMLVSGGLAEVGAMLLYSRATSPLMFFIAAALCGSAMAFVSSAVAATIINVWFAKRTGVLYGIAITLSGLSSAIFSPVIGYWIESMGWRMSFTISAGIALFATLMFFIFFRNSPADVGMNRVWAGEAEIQEVGGGAELPGATLREGMRSLSFWFIIVAWLGIGVVVYGVWSMVAVYVQDLGYDAVVAGAALSPMFAVNTLLPFALGWLVDRIPVRLVVSGGTFLFIMALVILLTEPALPGVYALAVLCGVGMSTGRSTLPMQTLSVFGSRDYASFIGIFNAAFSLGAALGQPLIAAFYDATGTYASAMKLFIPVAVIIILCELFLASRPWDATQKQPTCAK